jgi:hypothetical protein
MAKFFASIGIAAAVVALLGTAALGQVIVHNAIDSPGTVLTSDVGLGRVGGVAEIGFVPLPSYPGGALGSMDVIVRVTFNGAPAPTIPSTDTFSFGVRYFDSETSMRANAYGQNGPLTELNLSGSLLAGLSTPWSVRPNGDTWYRVSMNIAGFGALGANPSAGSTPFLSLGGVSASAGYDCFFVGSNPNPTINGGDYFGAYIFSQGREGISLSRLAELGAPFSNYAVSVSTVPSPAATFVLAAGAGYFGRRRR